MRRIILLLAVMLCLPFMAKAQDYNLIDSLYAGLDTLNVEERTQMKNLLDEMEAKFRKNQVKTVAGVPFGISKRKALSMLIKKFGYPQENTTQTIAYKYISYANNIYDSVIFDFKNDGSKSYLTQCIFVKYAKTFSEALDYEEMLAKQLSQKYTEVKRSSNDEGNPSHSCGVSPLWNGKLRDYFKPEYSSPAIHTFIVSNDDNMNGYNYTILMVYGPFNYVKEVL